MSALMQGLLLVVVCYQNPGKARRTFLGELIWRLLQLYLAQELGQKMDFQVQKGPRLTDWMSVPERELGDSMTM